MAQTTVRINKATRAVIKELSRLRGLSMQAIVTEAIEQYRRRCFLEEVNLAYESLREKSGEWSATLAERSEWDEALEDGLPSDEVWSDDGAVLPSGGKSGKSGKSGKK